MKALHIILAVLIGLMVGLAQAQTNNSRNSSEIENETQNESQNKTPQTNFIPSKPKPNVTSEPQKKYSPDFWGQMEEFVDGARDGAGKYLFSGINADSALLLISGGLVILLFLIPMTMITSPFWAKTAPPPDRKHLTSINAAAHDYQFGYNTGLALKPKQVDDIIDAFMFLQNVNVKITNSSTTLKRIQIKNCRACRGAKNQKKPICDFEKGFLSGAFKNLYKHVDVRETRCTAVDGECCEFEVKIR